MGSSLPTTETSRRWKEGSGQGGWGREKKKKKKKGGGGRRRRRREAAAAARGRLSGKSRSRVPVPDPKLLGQIGPDSIFTL